MKLLDENAEFTGQPEEYSKCTETTVYFAFFRTRKGTFQYFQAQEKECSRGKKPLFQGQDKNIKEKNPLFSERERERWTVPR